MIRCAHASGHIVFIECGCLEVKGINLPFVIGLNIKSLLHLPKWSSLGGGVGVLINGLQLQSCPLYHCDTQDSGTVMSFLLKEYVIGVAKYTSVPSFFDNAPAHRSNPAKQKGYILFPLKSQQSLVYFYCKYFIL